jgi:hypothetical protein
MLAVGWTAEREEVVPVEQDVHARLLSSGDRASDLGVVGMLWLKLDSYAYVRHHQLSDPRWH